MILPPYPSFPGLSGERISLREIHREDMEALLEISYYDAVRAATVQQAVRMQDRIHRDYLTGNSIHWGILDNGTGKIVGTCGYYRGFDKGEGELGCVLLQAYRGQGYMTAALLLAIDFGWQVIGLKRIRAVTSRQNQKAIQLLLRLNFAQVPDPDNEELEFALEPY